MKDKSLPPLDKFDGVIVGNIAKETNYDYLNNFEEREGGAIVYAATACASGGFKIAVSTKLAKKDEGMLRPLYSKHVDVYTKYNGITAEIENRFIDKTREDVLTICKKKGAPFLPIDIPEINTYYYIFVGDFWGDVPIETIKYFSELAYIAVDASCFVKRVNSKTRVVEYCDYPNKKLLASYCDVFKASLKEAKILTGLSDPVACAKMIKSWGAKEVLITERNTFHLIDENGEYWKNHVYEIETIGRLYRGTTAFVTYVLQRLTSDPDTSLYCAGAVTMCKLVRQGPVRCSRAELNNQLKFFYYYQNVRYPEMKKE